MFFVILIATRNQLNTNDGRFFTSFRMTYLCTMQSETPREQAWKELVEQLNKSFDADLDLQGILFLIGVQELGKGYKKLGKDQKLDVMHIAICTLLEPYGYYEFVGKDSDGWPHWQANGQLPSLKPFQQNVLMKEAIIEYFKANKFYE